VSLRIEALARAKEFGANQRPPTPQPKEKMTIVAAKNGLRSETGKMKTGHSCRLRERTLRTNRSQGLFINEHE